MAVTRGEAAALVIGCMTVILGAGLTGLGWYVNRRVAAWTSVLARLTAVEAKMALVDAAGTHRNREALTQMRRDFEALEDLHRRDLTEVDRRLASAALSQAQLAERLNSYTWGRRTDRHPRSDDPNDPASG